jgi:hypothetical protein
MNIRYWLFAKAEEFYSRQWKRKIMRQQARAESAARRRKEGEFIDGKLFCIFILSAFLFYIYFLL